MAAIPLLPTTPPLTPFPYAAPPAGDITGYVFADAPGLFTKNYYWEFPGSNYGGVYGINNRSVYGLGFLYISFLSYVTNESGFWTASPGGRGLDVAVSPRFALATGSVYQFSPPSHDCQPLTSPGFMADDLQQWLNTYVVSLAYVEYAYLQILPTTINTEYQVVAGLYNQQATALNANPAVQNPQGYAATQQAAVTALALATAATAQGVVNAQVTAATAIINGYKTSVVDPTAVTALALIAAQQAFALATIAAAQVTINNAIATYSAQVNAQVAALQAEAAAQQANATALVTAEQAYAMAQIAAATTFVLGQITAVQTQVAAATAQALALIASTVAGVQSQLADRPLYYGALTTPISVTNATDVIVIPPGGLTITAD